jgi:peptidoglycan/LPS O-acetylase OafA/YrhL
MMHRRYQPRLRTRALLLMVGVATMLLVSAHCDPYWSPNSAATLFLGYPAVALGCVAILLAFYRLRLDQRRLLTRVGIYLGKISYGLYIWQMIALVLVIRALDRPLPFAPDWVYSSTFEAVCAFVVTVGLASASYRFLETPFLRLKSRFAVISTRPE